MNDMIHMLKYYNITEDELALCSKINHTPYARGKFYFPGMILKKLIEERGAGQCPNKCPYKCPNKTIG
jgi:hypothetical protein